MVATDKDKVQTILLDGNDRINPIHPNSKVLIHTKPFDKIYLQLTFHTSNNIETIIKIIKKLNFDRFLSIKVRTNQLHKKIEHRQYPTQLVFHLKRKKLKN